MSSQEAKRGSNQAERATHVSDEQLGRRASVLASPRSACLATRRRALFPIGEARAPVDAASRRAKWDRAVPARLGTASGPALDTVSACLGRTGRGHAASPSAQFFTPPHRAERLLPARPSPIHLFRESTGAPPHPHLSRSPATLLSTPPGPTAHPEPGPTQVFSARLGSEALSLGNQWKTQDGGGRPAQLRCLGYCTYSCGDGLFWGLPSPTPLTWCVRLARCRGVTPE